MVYSSILTDLSYTTSPIPCIGETCSKGGLEKLPLFRAAKEDSDERLFY